MKPRCGRPDVSVTAFAAEALRTRRSEPAERALRNAARFADRCRNPDGGFFFTPWPEQAHQNKAGAEDSAFRSYATATCDALRIYRASAIPDSDPRVRDARSWLEKHPSLELPAGFPDSPEMRDRARSLRFYHLYARGRAVPSPELREQALRLRLPDGSWKNDLGLMKEDEPILATALALTLESLAPRTP